MVTAPPSRDPAHLLLIWLSPGFPVGAFAYSHGLEQAVARGSVRDAPGLTDWLAALLTHGSARADLILLAEAWRASIAGAANRVLAANDLALALQPSAERFLETTQQGAAFTAIVTAAWPAPQPLALLPLPPASIAYPVAVGTLAAGHSIALAPTLSAFAIAFMQNLVSAAIRLSVIGQTDGQRVLAALLPGIDVAVAEAIDSGPDQIGSATFAADLLSLAHETLYSRLFRS